MTIKPMSTAPSDRPFLVRTINGYTHFCRERENYADRAVAGLSRWEVYGIPVFVDDDQLEGWIDLPGDFTEPDFVGY